MQNGCLCLVNNRGQRELSFVSGISIKYLTNASSIESVSASTKTGLFIGITSVELDSVSKSLLITNMITADLKQLLFFTSLEDSLLFEPVRKVIAFT
jgi:hypothetical protein